MKAANLSLLARAEALCTLPCTSPRALACALVCLLVLAACNGAVGPLMEDETRPPGTGPVASDAPWELVFEDDFENGFDDGLWDRGTHTFEQNAARFRPENITYADGKMRLTLKDNPDPNGDRPYTGAELRTNNEGGFVTHGRFVVRMKAAQSSGVISSFFTFRYNPWQEIDIEFLGRDTDEMHMNIYFNPGPEGSARNQPYEVPPFPEQVALGYDASAEFHEYAFEWEPGVIRWYVDGAMVKETAGLVAPAQVPDLSTQIMMNIWASTAESWAGPIDDSAFPVHAEYDYVRFYQRADS